MGSCPVATRTASHMNSNPPGSPPDVVIVGGGGDVGLPLSLKLAEARLVVGIFDTNAETLALPFLESGADAAGMLINVRLAATRVGRVRFPTTAELAGLADRRPGSIEAQRG